MHSVRTRLSGLQRQTELVPLEGFTPQEMTVSPAGCLVRAADYWDVPVEYGELLGRSSHAFRIQVHPALCPSSPHPEVGASTLGRMFAVSPLDVRRLMDRGHPVPEPDLRRWAASLIGSGVPLMASWEESGLVVGYLGEGEAWVVEHPYREGGRRRVETGLPWALYALQPKPAPVDCGRLCRPAMAEALRLWESPPVDRYLLGRAAYEAWIDWAAHAPPAEFAAGSHGGFWIYTSLRESRAAAAAYLARHGAPAGLQRAFRMVREALEAGGLTPEALTTPAWSEAHPPTPASRARYAEVLAEARDRDTAAFRLLRSCLGLDGPLPHGAY